jgi:hypothetical protein
MKTMANPEMVQALLTRLGKVRLDTSRRWGRMTSHQMLCHLTDSFLVALGERSASPATGLLQRSVMKWGALYVPIQWPKGTPTRPEIEQGAGGTPPVEFGYDGQKLSVAIDRFAASAVLHGRFHPFFGSLTAAQWNRWGYLHTDHHLRQFGA